MSLDPLKQLGHHFHLCWMWSGRYQPCPFGHEAERGSSTKQRGPKQ